MSFETGIGLGNIIQMSYTNYKAREINFKVVYYGVDNAGKSTCLRYVFDHTDVSAKGKLIGLDDPEKDYRTYFFDFLPLGLQPIRGFQPRFHLYTVSDLGNVGRSNIHEICKAADGIVYVVDSARERLEETREDFIGLGHSLTNVGLSIDRIPLVLQYNKRDLPDAASLDEIRSVIGITGRKEFETVASEGTRVFDPLKAVIKQVVAASAA